MDIILNSLGGISAKTFVLWVIAIIIIIGAIIGLTIKAYKLIEKYRFARNSIEEKEDLILKHDKAIVELKAETSEIKGGMSKISDDIKLLSDALGEMKESNNSKERAKLKDRIGQAYSHYHEKKCLTSMEKESLEGLIKAYEEAGGLNSFVHSVVEVEMYTWELVD